MSILIKGMEMPKSCNDCRFLEGDTMDGLCHAANRWLDDEEFFLWHQYPDSEDIDDSMPANCPLIELSPHGDLIDRDYLASIIGKLNLQWEYGDGVSDCWNAIMTAPTIIPASDTNVGRKSEVKE